MPVYMCDVACAGCRSCLACKRKGVDEPSVCRWKDGLTPILDRIRAADRLIVGSPVYFGQTTSQFHALMERVCFPALSYNDYSSTFKGRIDVDVFLTMNASGPFYEEHYAEKFRSEFAPFHFLNGTTNVHAFCDTLQVKDYSLYDMAGFSEEHKRAVHTAQFPADLKRAFEIGADFSKG